MDDERVVCRNIRIKFNDKLTPHFHVTKRRNVVPTTERIFLDHLCEDVSVEPVEIVDWYSTKSHPAMEDFCSYLVVELDMAGIASVENMYLFVKTPCVEYMSAKNRRFLKLYDVSEQKSSKLAYFMDGVDLNKKEILEKMV